MKQQQAAMCSPINAPLLITTSPHVLISSSSLADTWPDLPLPQPFLGLPMAELWPVIRFKFASALQAWHPSDQSAHVILAPWHKVQWQQLAPTLLLSFIRCRCCRCTSAFASQRASFQVSRLPRQALSLLSARHIVPLI
jgi:hypothetical protein